MRSALELAPADSSGGERGCDRTEVDVVAHGSAVEPTGETAGGATEVATFFDATDLFQARLFLLHAFRVLTFKRASRAIEARETKQILELGLSERSKANASELTAMRKSAGEQRETPVRHGGASGSRRRKPRGTRASTLYPRARTRAPGRPGEEARVMANDARRERACDQAAVTCAPYPLSVLFATSEQAPIAAPARGVGWREARQIQTLRSSFSTTPRWRRSVVVARSYSGLKSGQISEFGRRFSPARTSELLFLSTS